MPHKLIVCRALAHVLEPMMPPDAVIRVMDIGLHVDLQRLKSRLLKEIADIEEEGTCILLGFGLCGRALEGVVSGRSTLVLPRIDDCVGALLGSRRRHKDLLKQNPGCYFLEQNWLNTECIIFTEIMKGMERVPPEKRENIVKSMLRHYNSLVLLDSGDLLPENESLCLDYARQYNLNLIRLKTELGLLTRLIKGPWSEEEFLVLPPGKAIPIF